MAEVVAFTSDWRQSSTGLIAVALVFTFRRVFKLTFDFTVYSTYYFANDRTLVQFDPAVHS